VRTAVEQSQQSLANAPLVEFGDTLKWTMFKLEPRVEGFADKSEIEDALTAVLTLGSLGAVIGGGTGLRYSYIDVALTDVERAVPVIRERLQRGRIGRRCWLQFYDDALAAEWVGLWPDSPEPPGLPR
jgi:hypothetical protein